jgi:hypothetical protein
VSGELAKSFIALCGKRQHTGWCCGPPSLALASFVSLDISTFYYFFLDGFLNVTLSPQPGDPGFDTGLCCPRNIC